MSGEEFLKNHFPKNEKICFAYLDGFDWMWVNLTKPYLEQIEAYKSHGYEMNSQISHLEISILLQQFVAEKCIILFDDTFFDDEYQIYCGKGGAAIPWLLLNGWTIDKEFKLPFEDGIVAFAFSLRNW